MGSGMAKIARLEVEKRLLDRQAAAGIRAHILTGVLPPGARLVETQLALELGVSRGTVRAALAQLAHEGLVHQVAFTRWQVAGATVADAWELYTLRGALEGLGARLAAERTDAVGRATLRQAWRGLEAAVAGARYPEAAEADFRLHEAIVAQAGHGRLAQQHRVVLQQVRFHMVHAGFLPQDYGASVAEHEALIEAVAGGDADRAERLARTHNESEVTLLSARLAETAAGKVAAS
jgi:DNA-binding GntR family transcriptional regulator